jgi:hypothetical protein
LNENKARNDSPVASTEEFKDFIDYIMANRSAPYKRIKNSIIHAVDKKSHNLEPDDLLYAVDVINTGQDITLSREQHQNNDVLVFKKDIDGEITFLAEARKKHDYLLVFDVWRKKKARRRSNAVKTPPGTYALNASPHADINSLSSDTGKKSSPAPNHQAGMGRFFSLTRRHGLPCLKEAPTSN